jgi:DNA-directed RNA polymerase subunit K/omega
VLLPYTSRMSDKDSHDASLPHDVAVDPAAPITSRFLFVDVAAQRAKQLRRGAVLRIERHTAGPHKLERLAMEEVRQQVVQYTLPPGYLGKGEAK